MDWLGKCETAKMPRVPITTDAIGKNAVLAIERAAEVRNNSVKAKGAKKIVQLRIPVDAIKKAGSTTVTDVLSVVEGAPELGDRIANLSAGGVPFGARGTVIAIHNKNACVDVVMDEEFMGGSSLQGTCSNFRGKLCYWNHLLKLSSKTDGKTVEQLVPGGLGKVAIEDLINKKEVEEKREREQREKRAKSVGKTNGNGRDSSAGKSPGYSKRMTGGAYKEATGPPMENGVARGIGFNKGAGRGFSSGLIASGILEDRSGSTNKKKQTSTTAKRIGNTNTIEKEDPAKVENANIGVGVAKVNNKESDVLKGMLGLGGSGSGSGSADKPPPAPPAKPTAADALMALMMGGGEDSGGDGATDGGGGGGGGFNFSYTNAGDDTSASAEKEKQENQIELQKQKLRLQQMSVTSTIVPREEKKTQAQGEEKSTEKKKKLAMKPSAVLKPAATIK